MGITILSLVMAWLTLSAIGNAAVILIPAYNDPLPDYFAVFAVAYGIAAAATTAGLWRMKPWTLTAFRAWGAACVALLVAFFVVSRMDQILLVYPEERVPFFAGFIGSVILIYWLLHRYIRKRVPPDR